MFPTPRPDDLLTAPACLECNNLLPNDEEVFRVLATSGDGLLNPTGRRIWEDRVRPTLVKNRRGFKSLLQKSLGQLDLYLSDGRYVGSHPGIQFEGPRIANVINKIAKGLYYVDTQCHLPINVEIKFDITQFDPGRYIEGELKEAISGARRIRIGDGEAVTYWRNCVADDPRSGDDLDYQQAADRPFY